MTAGTPLSVGHAGGAQSSPGDPCMSWLHARIDTAAALLDEWVAQEFESLRRSIGQRFRWQFRSAVARGR